MKAGGVHGDKKKGHSWKTGTRVNQGGGKRMSFE